jgi:GTP-binding protein
LIHLLDGLAEDPLIDYAQINSELALFDPDLAKKPQVVALNKMDLPDVQARWEDLQRKLKKKGISAMAVSAATGTNVKQMLSKAYDLLREAPVIIPDERLPVYSPVADPRKYEIKRISDGWRISGSAIERAAAMTYWDNDASIRRFQRILETLGIDKDLRKAGVREGDMVSISDYVLEWMD